MSKKQKLIREVCGTKKDLYQKQPDKIKKIIKMIDAVIEEATENIKKYVEKELLKTLKAEKEFNDDEKGRPAYCYLQGIESALISLDEHFNFCINEEI